MEVISWLSVLSVASAILAIYLFVARHGLRYALGSLSLILYFLEWMRIVAEAEGARLNSRVLELLEIYFIGHTVLALSVLILLLADAVYRIYSRLLKDTIL